MHALSSTPVPGHSHQTQPALPALDESLGKAIDQFESLLTHELIKSMRATVSAFSEEGESDFGTGMSTEMSDQALAEHIGGKLGIADVLRKQLSQGQLDPEGTAKDATSFDPLSHASRYAGPIRRSPTEVGPQALATKGNAGIIGLESHLRGELPVAGIISSEYGPRIHPVTHEHSFHEGLDIAAPAGTEIHAVDRGKVVFAGMRGGYGNTVEIEHADGTHTLYGHASKLHVRKGDTVEAGETIADVGSTGRSTGPHVHFEARRGEKALAPKKYLEGLRAYKR